MGMRTPGVFTPGLGSAAISAASGRIRVRNLIVEEQPVRLDQSMLHRAGMRQPGYWFNLSMNGPATRPSQITISGVPTAERCSTACRAGPDREAEQAQVVVAVPDRF